MPCTTFCFPILYFEAKLVCILLGDSNQSLGASAISYMKEEIQKALSKGKAAGVLRLVFHDAGTFDINDKTGSYLTTCSFLSFHFGRKLKIAWIQFPASLFQSVPYYLFSGKFVLSLCAQCHLIYLSMN